MKGNECYAGEGKAPTICLEGTTQRQGSHGKAHTNLEKILTRKGLPNGAPASYPDFRDAAIEAIQGAGAGHCNKKCLQAQLDEYYKKCNKGDEKNIKAHSGIPRETVGGISGDNGDLASA
ncbi:GHH signature containing HNH/Endo VII superfamily nuclease toxin 2 [compost metagenome]